MSFWCLQIYQKPNKFFVRISALALYITNWMILFYSPTLLFWFDIFLEARAEILRKNLKTPKGHFELTDLYLSEKFGDSSEYILILFLFTVTYQWIEPTYPYTVWPALDFLQLKLNFERSVISELLFDVLIFQKKQLKNLMNFCPRV